MHESCVKSTIWYF